MDVAPPDGIKRPLPTDVEGNAQAAPLNIGGAGAQLINDVGRIMQRHNADVQKYLQGWLQRHSVVDLQMPENVDVASCDELLESLLRSDAIQIQPTSQMPVRVKSTKSQGFDHVLPPSTPRRGFEQIAATPGSVEDHEIVQKFTEGGTPAHTPKSSKKTKEKKRLFARNGGPIFADTKAIETSELTAFQKFTHSHRYEWASAGLILVNAVFIAWETQYMGELTRDSFVSGNHSKSPEKPSVFMVFAIIFSILFSLELGLRWAADGLIPFFRTADASWNAADVIVVVCSLADCALEVAVAAEAKNVLGSNIAVIRTFRIVRVVRVFRVIRVMKFFRELRIMVYSILRSMKSLLWIAMVLGIVFSVFGIAFTSAVTDYFDDLDAWQDEKAEGLKEHFMTLDKSFLTLLGSMSGGNDWAEYYGALAPLGLHYEMMYLVFISFALFAVLNIVTGVFVDSAKQSAHVDRDILVQEEMDAKASYLHSMRLVFEEMDLDESGVISSAEFARRLKDERVEAYFKSMKLDVSDATNLFSLLDYDHSDEVSVDEFLEGCYKLQGESRRLDAVMMQYELRFLSEAITEIRESMAHRLETAAVEASMRKLSTASGTTASSRHLT